MRKILPIAILAFTGTLMLVQYFVPNGFSQDFFSLTGDWYRTIEIFAFLLGLISVTRVHLRRIQLKGEGWKYSTLVFAGVALLPIATIIDSIGKVGFVPFIKGEIITDGPAFDWLFFSVQVPLGATVFSMLAFFITSATYRAFRARTFDAALLLTAGVIVLMANAPPTDGIWNAIFPWENWQNMPTLFKDWILEVPNGSAQRAILLGLGLGAVSQSLRIILGIDRAWLGG